MGACTIFNSLIFQFLSLSLSCPGQSFPLTTGCSAKSNTMSTSMLLCFFLFAVLIQYFNKENFKKEAELKPDRAEQIETTGRKPQTIRSPRRSCIMWSVEFQKVCRNRHRWQRLKVNTVPLFSLLRITFRQQTCYITGKHAAAVCKMIKNTVQKWDHWPDEWDVVQRAAQDGTPLQWERLLAGLVIKPGNTHTNVNILRNNTT